MSKGLELTITDGQSGHRASLEKAMELLRGLPRGYETAVSRSLNRAATSGRAAAVATIREEYTIKASLLRGNFNIEKATRRSLETVVSAKGANLPLSNYKTRPKTDTTGNKRKPVRASVKKGSVERPLGSSFVYRGRILQRLGKRSLPVKELYGPAVPVIANNPVVVGNVQKAMTETFQKRLEHEAEFLLSGKGKR